MSADNEEDSHMLSSPEDSEPELLHSTAAAANKASSAQTRAMPISAPGASMANSNGKRPIQTISNGMDDAEERAAMANGKARQEYSTQTHQPSGYTWSKPEEAPGYAWLNKKAMDEYHRAWESLVHKDYWMQNKLSDDFVDACERDKTNSTGL